MRIKLTSVLAIVTYAAAVGIAVADWPAGLWIIGIACAFMCEISHPASSHLICSASLVLMVLIQTGRIEWMSEFIPAFGIVLGLVGSTKVCKGAANPILIPQTEVLCPLERERRDMERILRSECGDGDD